MSRDFKGIYPSLDEIKRMLKNPNDKSLRLSNRKTKRVTEGKDEFIENQADTIAINQVWGGIRDFINGRGWE